MSDRNQDTTLSVRWTNQTAIADDRSLQSLTRRCYNALLRPRLPRKLGLYNGVVARQPRLLDATDHIPNYKETFLGHVEEAVDGGETVVVIGGGKGIASVVAAEAAGPGGRVVTYEASESQAEICRETLALNDVSHVSTVESSLVGPAKNVYGGDSADPIGVDDLPAHDTLVMDCEGAEREILSSLADVDGHRSADRIVVETHSRFDAPKGVVTDRLATAGYDVVEADEATWADASNTDWVCTARESDDE